MATQWTAGLTSGSILPAATLNTIGAAWVDYTPTLTQGATVTKTITNARYCQIQKTVFVQVKLVATSAGTAANSVVIGLPLAARTANATVSGIMTVYDASTNVFYTMGSQINSTTTTEAYYQTGSPFGVSPAITIAANDQLQLNLTYEIA